MPIDHIVYDETPMRCDQKGCTEERVSGSKYCEDHDLQQQVKAHNQANQPPRVSTHGTLADLIRNATGKGLIAPVTSGYQHA